MRSGDALGGFVLGERVGVSLLTPALALREGRRGVSRPVLAPPEAGGRMGALRSRGREGAMRRGRGGRESRSPGGVVGTRGGVLGMRGGVDATRPGAGGIIRVGEGGMLRSGRGGMPRAGEGGMLRSGRGGMVRSGARSRGSRATRRPGAGGTLRSGARGTPCCGGRGMASRCARGGGRGTLRSGGFGTPERRSGARGAGRGGTEPRCSLAIAAARLARGTPGRSENGPAAGRSKRLEPLRLPPLSSAPSAT